MREPEPEQPQEREVMLMLVIESLDVGQEPVSLTAVRSGEEIMLRLCRQDPGEELPLSGKLLGSISLDRKMQPR